MITFPEFKDIDEAIEEICEKINKDISQWYKEEQTSQDSDYWMVAGLSQAKKALLLTFVTHELLSDNLFRQLFDERIEQVAKRLELRR